MGRDQVGCPPDAAQCDGPGPGRGAQMTVVALVASTGGLNALSRVLADLPPDLPAAVIVAQHLDPTGPSALTAILADRTAWRVRAARDGDRLEPGLALITPPGRHLLVTGDHSVVLVETDQLPPARPSADLLLTSLAVAVGRSAVAVVLTGSGHDGQTGVRAVHRCGGRVIAQDEASSTQFGMPGAAIATGVVDLVVGLDGLAEAITTMVRPVTAPRGAG